MLPTFHFLARQPGYRRNLRAGFNLTQLPDASRIQIAQVAMIYARLLVVSALVAVAGAFQAPASAVPRSVQQLQPARFSTVAMVADMGPLLLKLLVMQFITSFGAMCSPPLAYDFDFACWLLH